MPSPRKRSADAIADAVDVAGCCCCCRGLLLMLRLVLRFSLLMLRLVLRLLLMLMLLVLQQQTCCRFSVAANKFLPLLLMRMIYVSRP